MKPITLKEALLTYVKAVLADGPAPNLYLKDGDKHYHNVDEIDLMRDRICCDDGYWNYYEFILQVEGGEEHELFIEVSNDE